MIGMSIVGTWVRAFVSLQNYNDNCDKGRGSRLNDVKKTQKNYL